MSPSLKTKRTIRFVLGMVAAWTVASLLATELALDPNNPPGPEAAAISTSLSARLGRALLAGILAGGLSSLLELKILPRHQRRFSVGAMLAFRTFAYAIVAWLSIMGVARVVVQRDMGIRWRDFVHSGGLAQFVTNPDFGQLMLAMIVSSFVINGFFQLNRVVGPGVTLQILAGRYLKPQEEHRVFMFLDITGSTSIAEEIGPLSFSGFRNDFFHDLAEPVLLTRGQIVQYVGDEAVITWPVEMGLRDGNCLRCFLLMDERVRERAEQYLNRYGVVPSFKAGVHGGPVVVSEIGDLKREISFSGDTMNTAARIETMCRTMDRRLLFSESVLTAQAQIQGTRAEDLGPQSLRGKEESVRLYALQAGAGPLTLAGSDGASQRQ